MQACKHCGETVNNRVAIYCSNKCQADFEYNLFISKWKNGEIEGGTGINARTLSGHIKRYMHEQYGKCCQLCGWDKIHPITKKVPLEIDHIDGNSENNSENNLQLICPNCHALTSNFRNLNYGKGREWRRVKYIKST